MLWDCSYGSSIELTKLQERLGNGFKSFDALDSLVVLYVRQ